MRSKSLLLSVAVFLAAATPSIVFDASRAQVGTADVATADDSGSGVGTADIAEEVDPGFGVDPGTAEEEEEVVSEGPEPDPCGNSKCDLNISKDVEYTSIEGSGDRDAINGLEGATLSISEGG